MGIAPDGDRSTKRLWYAKKLLNKIKMLELPKATSIFEGFTYIVLKLGDIVTGRIMAPMGAVVICTGPYEPDPVGAPGVYTFGARVMTADYWLGGFQSKAPMKTMFRWDKIDLGWTNYLTGIYTADELTGFGYTTEQWYPLTALDVYPPSRLGLGDENDVYLNNMPTPVILPYKGGEAFWSILNGYAWKDRNADDVVDNNEDGTVAEAFVNFYSSDGGSLSKRISYYWQDNFSQFGIIKKIYQLMPSSNMGFVKHQMGIAYPASSNKWYMAYYFNLDKNNLKTSVYFYANDLWVDVPAGLQTIILDAVVGGPDSSVKPIGQYAFSTAIDSLPTLLSAVDLTYTGFGVLPHDEQAWFAVDHVNRDMWKIFYTINQHGSAPVTVNADNILPALHVISGCGATPATVANWDAVRKAFYQMFPLPNANWLVPTSSVMFHDGAGVPYTWAVKYGGHSFNSVAGGGLKAEPTMTMPAEALGNIRPTIYFCGRFNGTDLYICVCEQLALAGPRGTSPVPATSHEIVAIYYGSPFTSWTKIDDPAVDNRMVHVRPIYANVDTSGVLNIKMLGIMEDETIETPGYHFASISVIDGIGTWKRLGKLPILSGMYYNWGVGLFGEGALVNQMTNFMHQPAALPQMPVGPYNLYEQP